MKKIKKFWQENKVLATMTFIIIVCIIICVALLLKYFYFGNGGTKYGDRLDGIENVMITEDKKNEVKEALEAAEIVDSAKVEITGKIVYTRIVFGEKATLVEAESLAVKALDYFSDEEKGFYDFSFTLIQEASANNEGFKIMGAKNVNGSNLVWNNNNVDTTSGNAD